MNNLILERLEHHAYLLIGERQPLVQVVTKLLERITGRALLGQPDLVWRETENFGIDDSRRLHDEQARRAFAGGRKFFVLIVDSITLPAQQALLKIFEEPTPHTHFFLIYSDQPELLPTLKSRCQIIRQTPAPLADNFRQQAEKFLTSWPAERLVLVSEINNPQKFVRALELACHERLLAHPNRAWAEVVESVKQAENYLGGSAGLPRLVFEHLSLTLPRWPIQKM
ncbi:MAG: hypothetical protein AAB505_02070 [Patescibacteria group bacterium]